MNTILPAEVLSLLACPVCGNALVEELSRRLRCSVCARLYPVIDGIPILLADRAIIDPAS